jgi:hypothetical protein
MPGNGNRPMRPETMKLLMGLLLLGVDLGFMAYIRSIKNERLNIDLKAENQQHKDKIEELNRTVDNVQKAESELLFKTDYKQVRIKPDDILHAEKISVSDIVRRIYLYAEEDPSERVQALYRPLAKAGDYLLDHLNRQWQVDAILEDFSAEGWVSVQAIMQPIPQTLIIVPDTEVTNGDN